MQEIFVRGELVGERGAKKEHKMEQGKKRCSLTLLAYLKGGEERVEI